MDSNAGQVFLRVSAAKLRQLSGRIETCLSKLNDEQIWLRGGENSNAVGNLVLHLCGNMGQWIGSGVGGKPDTRVRDREFAARGAVSTAELRERLSSVIAEALGIIEALPPDRLVETTTVQSYTVTLMEAIYHVVEHFAQHTGQIIFQTKFLTGEDLGFYAHLKAKTHTQPTP